jgi:hypothetical protein
MCFAEHSFLIGADNLQKFLLLSYQRCSTSLFEPANMGQSPPHLPYEYISILK